MTAVKFKVTVDPDRCQGHNRCFAIAPEVFDVDDLGNAFAIGDGTVGDVLATKARQAAANCPEYAITVTELQG
jgi:ferredoxin